MISRLELHNVTRVTQQLQQFGTFSVLRISAYVEKERLLVNFDLFISNREGLPIEVQQTKVCQN